MKGVDTYTLAEGHLQATGVKEANGVEGELFVVLSTTSSTVQVQLHLLRSTFLEGIRTSCSWKVISKNKEKRETGVVLSIHRQLSGSPPFDTSTDMTIIRCRSHRT